MAILGSRAAARASTAIVLGLALTATGAASAMSSSAYGIQADFTYQHIATGLGPIGSVSGAAPPGYAKTVNLGPFHQTVPIVPDTAFVPTLIANTASMKTHVTANGIAVDSASAEGDATVKGLDLSLVVNPPPGSLAPVLELLHVTAGRVTVDTSFVRALPGPLAANSTASFVGLTISGPLVGNQTIKFTGDAPNNMVLFQSPTLTITVNNKLMAGVISCTPKCTFSPVSVTGSALDIALTNADLGGKSVSGDIVVAEARAGTSGLSARTDAFVTGK